MAALSFPFLSYSEKQMIFNLIRNHVKTFIQNKATKARIKAKAKARAVIHRAELVVLLPVKRFIEAKLNRSVSVETVRWYYSEFNYKGYDSIG